MKLKIVYKKGTNQSFKNIIFNVCVCYLWSIIINRKIIKDEKLYYTCRHAACDLVFYVTQNKWRMMYTTTKTNSSFNI